MLNKWHWWSDQGGFQQPAPVQHSELQRKLNYTIHYAYALVSIERETTNRNRVLVFGALDILMYDDIWSPLLRLTHYIHYCNRANTIHLKPNPAGLLNIFICFPHSAQYYHSYHGNTAFPSLCQSLVHIKEVQKIAPWCKTQTWHICWICQGEMESGQSKKQLRRTSQSQLDS